MKRYITFVCVLLPSFLTVASVSGQGSREVLKKNDITLSIGTKTWINTGEDDFTIAGSVGCFDAFSNFYLLNDHVNILSDLEYKNLDSTIVEIYGELSEQSRGFLTVAYGLGSIKDGIYRDSDYYGDDRTDLFSLSTGDADDDKLWYFSIDYAYRIFWRPYKNKKQKASIDLLVGYQYWEEDITMTNGDQKVSALPPPCLNIKLGPFSGLDSTYLFTWKSIRVGVRGTLPISHRLYIKGKAMFIPWTDYEGEGVWNLRSDFREDPSFKHDANGGIGIQLEAALSYNVWHTLFLEAGYRYWYIESDDGTDTTFFTNGLVSTTPFNKATNERHGVIVGVNYTF